MGCVLIPRFIGPVYVDVVMGEKHESSLNITRNPVEFGADVTDHAYVQPKKVQLECVSGQSSMQAAANYQMLVAVQETREPFDLITGLDIYPNMLIESISVTRHKDNSRVLDFSASLIEVIFAHSYSGATAAPLALGAAFLRGEGMTDRGLQSMTPSTLDPATVEGARNLSILRQALPLLTR